MMRIIAGDWRGKRLEGGEDREIRPTTDRMRERLFSILQHSRYPELDGARVADLCAGSGALGLEALSRGAAFCVFVEQNSKALRLLTGNIKACGGVERADIRQGRAELFEDNAPFDFIFADPPYRAGLATPILARIAAQNLLAADGLMVIETHKATDLDMPTGFVQVDERRQGEQKLTMIMHAE